MPDSRVQIYIENPFFDQFLNSTESIVNNVSVNLYVYDLNDTLIQYIEDIPSERWQIFENYLDHDLYYTLFENKIFNGTYKIKYAIFNNFFGNSTRKLNIKNISAKRLELRIVPSLSVFSWEEITHFSATAKQDVKNNLLSFYIKTKNHDLLQIVNFRDESRPNGDPRYSFIAKLDEPASEDIAEGDDVNIVIPLNQENYFTVNIIPINNTKTLNVLDYPDFSQKINKRTDEPSGYKNWSDLVSQNQDISSKLVSSYLSSGSFGIDINIDFRLFENFISFSSAEKRLDAFKYKLTNIQDLENSINLLYSSVVPASSSVTSSNEFSNNIIKYQNKKTEILQSFDFYENYLYYSTSSYESSSFGEFTSMSWPKFKSGSFYIPYPVTSSQSINWYNSTIYSASLFDNQNENALVRYVPEFILQNEISSNYVTFVQSIGHMFDNLLIYVKAQNNFYHQDESIYTGIAKDLIYTLLKSFGWDAIQDHQLDDLWFYKLGTNDFGELNPTGSYSINEQIVSASNETIPYGDISKEFWKRILNNLPYLFKTKGTKEGIRSLINCYGIPSTILSIKEYGGPEKISAKSYYQFDKFTYAIDFDQDDGAYIQVVKAPLEYSNRTPNTIEFRFRTINASLYKNGLESSLANQCILRRNDGNVMFTITNTSNQNGTIKAYFDGDLVCSTNEGPIFNGDWWTFMFRHNQTSENVNSLHTFDIFAKQAKWYDISYELSSSFTLNGSRSDATKLQYWFEEYEWNFGSSPAINSYYPFHGQMQEFRYWCNILTESEFDNHVMAPTSIFTTDSFNNLGLRFPLGTDFKRIDSQTTSSIYSKHPNFNIAAFADGDGELTGSFKFQSSTIKVPYDYIVDYYSLEYPDLSSNRYISTKVRTEENLLTRQLNEFISYDFAEYDKYPNDTNKFGVYFSPTHEINKDIAEQYGGFKIDDYIGGWNNFFSSSYIELENINRQYLKKFYTIFNIRDFLRLTDFYNSSLFDHIKENTPARSKKLLGVVIEPHILNRSKIALSGQEPIFEQLQKESIIDYTFGDFHANIENISLAINYSSFHSCSANVLNEYENTPISCFLTGSQNDINYEYSTIMTQRVSENKYEYYRSSGSYSGQTFSPGTVPHNKINFQDYLSTGLYRLFYSGCKISSVSINSPTISTFDGKAVVETFINESNTLISDESENGLLEVI